MIFFWYAPIMGLLAAGLLLGLLEAWLDAEPKKPKPNQWARYRGVEYLRETYRREPVLDTAAFSKWLRSNEANKKGR